MATKKINLEFRVLLYPEDGLWIAHGLEMDLPAEGKTPREALKNFIDLANLQIATALDEGNLDSIFSQAPPSLWRLFSQATASRPAILSKLRHDSIERLSVRELVPA